MSEITLSVLLILLGWLLGILTTPINDYAKNHYTSKKIREAIIIELQDLSIRFLVTAFKVKDSQRSLTLEFAKSAQKQILDYSGNEPMDGLKDLANLNEESLNFFVLRQNSAQKNPQETLSYKTITTNVINSHMVHAGLLKPSLLAQVLEIKFHIDIFNQEVSSANELIRLTFDSSLSKENRDIVTKNIEAKGGIIAKRCEAVVTRINKILEQTS